MRAMHEFVTREVERRLGHERMSCRSDLASSNQFSANCADGTHARTAHLHGLPYTRTIAQGGDGSFPDRVRQAGSANGLP